MAVTKENTENIIKKFQRSELDTGSSEVQVALLTANINELTKHAALHKKDVHSRRGIIRAVNLRRKLLDYMKRTDLKKYESMIKALDIRK